MAITHSAPAASEAEWRISIPRWREFAQRISRSHGAQVGFVILCALVLVALFAPLIAPFDPIQISVAPPLLPPGAPHIFGTDQFGRDVFSRVVAGTQVSLAIGLIAVSIASLIGVTLGLISGFYGGLVDML
ncbi:MAG: hypothetical protein LC737_06195, partial [Chloroflexi bacterium]|nr:hypothetical protein [Chloroflexota bacterium]